MFWNKPKPDTYVVNDETELHHVQREQCMTALMNSIQTDFENVVKARPKAKTQLFTVMVGWIIFIGFLVLFNDTCNLGVSDSVLIALVSGGAAQVIGLYLVVATHLFPRSGVIISPEVLTAINNIDRTPDDPSSFNVTPSSSFDSGE